MTDRHESASRRSAATASFVASAVEPTDESANCGRSWRWSGSRASEAFTPDIHGEYETKVERAAIAIEPQWFPAVNNRAEGVFLQLRAYAVKEWLARPALNAVAQRPTRDVARCAVVHAITRLKPGLRIPVSHVCWSG